MSASNAKIDAVDTGIIWSRIVSTAEEMVSALVRTAFSTMVRESGDYSCMIFDSRAKLLAQGTTSVPSFTGTGPHTLNHVLKYVSAEDMRDGDIIITNDPWIGTGHTYDINVIKPVFHHKRLVGYCLTVSHLSDVGGVGMGSVAKDVYEEGFSLPPVKLFEAGVENKFIVEFIRNNVRTVDFVLGDIYSNVASCNVGAQGLVKVLSEYDQVDTMLVADAIFALTRRSVAAKLMALPKGVHRGTMFVEGGADYPDINLAVSVAISEAGFDFDFDGTDPVVRAGVNVPICYTRAFCYFCAKVLVAPDLPNNQAVLDFVTIRAPDNCILNALRPHPTGARHIFGHAVGPLIFGTLAEALPNEVQADSGMVFQVNLRGQTRAGRRYSSIYFSPGGYGALAGYDGRPALPAPSNMISGSIEVWEEQTNCTFLQKEIRTDTGGAGEFQGGNGQIIRLRNDSGLPIEASFMASRTRLAARGFAGGEKGAARVIRVQGEVIDPKARVIVPDEGVIEVEDVGGGGFGDPRCRDAARVAADLANGLITREYAAKHYPIQMSKLRMLPVAPSPEKVT
jgi:N-methylhydantoinase B